MGLFFFNQKLENVSLRFLPKASTAWQFFNWTIARIPFGKKPLMLNMDETACRLFYESKPGILATRAIAKSASRGLLSQQAKRGNTRASLSLVALICDDSSIQPKLPQFLLGNEHILPVPLAGQLKADGGLPSNIRVCRHKSAWINDEKLADIVAHWSRALAEFRHSHQPILILDACPAHLGPKFLGACRRHNIWVQYIPARMTWLLQPCDTHCFGMLKRMFRREYHLALITSATGQVGVRRIVEIIVQGVREVMQGHRWAPAFVGNGWQYQQRFIRQKILKLLEWDTIPSLPAILPNYKEMRSIFPGNREIPFDVMLGVHRPPPPRRVHAPPPLPPPLGVPLAPGGVWHGRLRSSSKLQLDSSEAAPAQAVITDSAPPIDACVASEPWHPSALPSATPPPLPPRRRLFPVGRRMPPPMRARVRADSVS